MLNKFNRLDELEIDELSEVGGEEEVKERFKITDLDSLNWALRKLSALSKKQAQFDELMKSETERIKAWHASETKDINERVKFFEFLISEYADKRREEDAKFNKETTPYGEVSFKKQLPSWNFFDENKIVEFLKNNELETLIRTTETIENKTNFKKFFDIRQNVFVENGVVVDEAGEDGKGIIYSFVVREEDGETLEDVVNNESGEFALEVDFMPVAVVERMSEKVVPGLTAEIRPDEIKIKAAE